MAGPEKANLPSAEEEEEAITQKRFIFTMRSKVAISGVAFFSAVILLAAFSAMAHSNLDLAEEATRYVTIFRDDFDTLGPGWFPWEQAFASVNSSGGYVHLNLEQGQAESSVSSILDFPGDWKMKWRYVGVEIRLKCGDSNGLLGGAGEGHRAWGFGDPYPNIPENFLLFNSYSPGSGQSLVGFYACVGINGSIVRRRNITQIDMREWHDYTILWSPDNATFLIDDELVLTTEEVPNIPLAVAIGTENRLDDLKPDGSIMLKDFVPLAQNQWIQIDYIDIFMDREEYEDHSEAASQTLIQASRVLLSAELRGIDTQELIDELAQAEEALNQRGYIPSELHVKMASIAEDLPPYVEKLSDLFAKAQARIERDSLDGRDTRILQAHYDRATRAFRECQYSVAIAYLEKITEDESE